MAGFGPQGFSSPAVANGVVYAGDLAGTTGILYAFDATGATGCSGTPKTCNPLWTGVVSGADMSTSSPAVANGVVYIGSAADHKLYAFGAAGTTGCSGSPKTCAPLWSATTPGFVYSSPSVTDGNVYVGANDETLSNHATLQVFGLP